MLEPGQSEAVRDLVGRYAEAVDRGRAEELAELFTPDGVLEILGESFDSGRYEGRAAIAQRIAQSARGATGISLIRHHVSSLRVSPLPRGEAQADSYFLALTERGVDHWGRYRDRIAFGSDGPCFATRQVSHEGWVEGSWLERMNAA
jgi:ketosteroid isomerase-like protein